MFDVGFGELVLIALVALLVLGPERMPKAARTAGTLLRRARQSWASVRAEVERELQAEELKRQLHDGTSEVRKTLEGVDHDVRQAGDEITRAADPHASSAAPPPARDGQDARRER